jgi:hypothetical protein
LEILPRLLASLDEESRFKIIDVNIEKLPLEDR